MCPWTALSHTSGANTKAGPQGLPSLPRTPSCILCVLLLQFSLRVNKVSTTRASVKVSLTVRDSVTNAAIPGVYVTGQFSINPDVACTDVLAAFPVGVLGTLSTGAGSTTSPSFQNKKAAASCLKNSAYPGSQVTFSVTGLQAAGYEIDTTKPASITSSYI